MDAEGILSGLTHNIRSNSGKSVDLSRDVSEKYLQGSDPEQFALEEVSSINIQLSNDQVQKIEELQKTLDTLRSIPEKLAIQQSEFDAKRVEALNQRLKIFTNLGPLASDKEYEFVLKEALSIARQSLKNFQLTLAPKLDVPAQLMESLIETNRDGNSVEIIFNKLVPNSGEG